jgi:hypothetical protein
VIVLFPVARLLPLTVNAAVAVAPEIVMVADPSVVLPLVKVTIPDGAAVPVAAFTDAVTTVAPLCAIAAGLAVTDVAVFTGGAVTVTITEAVEPEKFPVAE